MGESERVCVKNTGTRSQNATEGDDAGDVSQDAKVRMKNQNVECRKGGSGGT